MKTVRFFSRSITAPAFLGAVMWLALGTVAGGAESPAAPISPIHPVTNETDTASLGSLRSFVIPESILTAEQRAIYRAAMETSRGRVQAIDAQLHLARNELAEAIFADILDENRVREKAMVIAQLEGERAVLRARALAVIRPSLTPEQMVLLTARPAVPRPKPSPQEMETKRQEVQAHLETRLAEEHEATRQRLALKLEGEIAELRKQQAGGALTAEEKERLNRLERMRDRLKSGGE